MFMPVPIPVSISTVASATMGVSDWLEFAGLGISIGALIWSVKSHQNTIEKQFELYNQQKQDHETELAKMEQTEIEKCAYVFVNVIPEMIHEGFRIYGQHDNLEVRNEIKKLSAIFIDYDFSGKIDLLKNVLNKNELLYLYKLCSIITKLKMQLGVLGNSAQADKNYEVVIETYNQFVEAFCNGFPDCGDRYYIINANNKRKVGEKMPSEYVAQYQQDQRTLDFILIRCCSYFKNNVGWGDNIYGKLKEIGCENND